MSPFRLQRSSAGREFEDLMRTIACIAVILAAGCATAPAGAPTRAAAPTANAAFRTTDIENRTGAELDARLGPPALIRIEGRGEFRRYAFAACSLMIILYPDEKGVRRVRHADASALIAGAANPDLETCLASGLAAGR